MKVGVKLLHSASDYALSLLADSDVHVVVNPEPHPKASKGHLPGT